MWARVRRRAAFPLVIPVVVAGALATAVPARSAPTANVYAQRAASWALAGEGATACGVHAGGGRAFFTSCTGNHGQPEYWCADYAMWAWAMGGAGYVGELDAAAYTFLTFGLRHGTLTGTPAPGYVAVFASTAQPASTYTARQIVHVAVVTAVSGGAVVTESGDWGGVHGSEAQFSATSHVVDNGRWAAPVGTRVAAVDGYYLVGYVAPIAPPPPPRLPPRGAHR